MAKNVQVTILNAFLTLRLEREGERRNTNERILMIYERDQHCQQENNRRERERESLVVREMEDEEKKKKKERKESEEERIGRRKRNRVRN